MKWEGKRTTTNVGRRKCSRGTQRATSLTQCHAHGMVYSSNDSFLRSFTASSLAHHPRIHI